MISIFTNDFGLKKRIVEIVQVLSYVINWDDQSKYCEKHWKAILIVYRLIYTTLTAEG